MKTESGKNGNNGGKKARQKPGYQAVPLSMNRRVMAATLDIAHQQNNIHAILEVDISEPRRVIQAHRRIT